MRTSLVAPSKIQTHSNSWNAASTEHGIWIRKFPYPFKAALAICSDIDETQTIEEFLEIQRFLCSEDSTRLGEGLGLEIGNSFYFYDEKRRFSFFTHALRRPM